MNLTGKILVFLVLFFSVVFMTVALMLYATHKHWREEIERKNPTNPGWKMKVELLQAENTKLADEKKQLHDQLVTTRLSSDVALAGSETKVAQLEKINQDLAKNKVEADKQLATSAATLQTQQQSLAMHQEAETKVRETLFAQLKENDDRHKAVVTLTNEFNAAAVDNQVLKEREEQLAAQVAQAKLLLAKMGQTIEDPIALIPPPVDGTIVALGRRDDPNLIELSMGRDDGLRLNHRVDLYRGKDYLGYAVITELEPSGNRVAAKVMDKKAQIRVGDNFTTRFQSLTLTKKQDGG